ncbi:hypothetical protein [Corallococcus exiguus]|nr:hypothetical protein [Corallococcus exiguus]
MKRLWPLLVLMTACASVPSSNERYVEPGRGEPVRGPWSEVASFEMPTGDVTIPIDLLRDVADALLKLPGAKTCDPSSQRPIVGLSMEYCSTVYVAGTEDALSWRVTKPLRGSYNGCQPSSDVTDSEHSAEQIWIVGYIHNHPCGTPPSTLDLTVWPTDAFAGKPALAEFRMIPGNPAPAMFKGQALLMASALVAERTDGSRVFLRYFPTGEIEQWSQQERRWRLLGTCIPTRTRYNSAPLCRDGAVQLLAE